MWVALSQELSKKKKKEEGWSDGSAVKGGVALAEERSLVPWTHRAIHNHL